MNRCGVCRSGKYALMTWLGKNVCERCLGRHSTTKLKEHFKLPDANKCPGCGVFVLIHWETRELHNRDGTPHSCKDTQAEEEKLLEIFGG